MAGKSRNRCRQLLTLSLAALAIGALLAPACCCCAQEAAPKTKAAAKSKLKGNELTGAPDTYESTSLFGLEARGSKFVYVFDRSGSMGDRKNLPLRKAKEELLASLNGLSEQQQFYVIFYNEEPRLFNPGPSPNRLVFATDDNKQRAKRFVASITADGGTDHMSALSIAIRLHPDVIFLLTDGEAQDDPTPDDLKRLERLNSGEASINVIQFADTPRPDSTLVQLAEQNRGKHIVVDPAKFADSPTAGKKN